MTDPTDPALLAFLSWARSGAVTAGDADPLSGPLPAAGPVPLGYRVNDRAERTLSARLYGPGDVTALDPGQLIRTDPRPGDDTFPPYLFPLVEFDRPELPWLLTPAGPAERDRLRPWLVLVVVDRDRAQLVPGSASDAVDPAAAGAALPVLRCRLEDLPHLDESHLWAHVQVALDGALDDARLDRLLAGEPSRTLSRLICPRRLQPRRPYLACVVPAFEAGRKTGLGLSLTPADATTLTPAWGSGTGDAPPLPVYHHWEFATGDAGSFEALVNRLHGRPLPRSVGILPVDVSRPGGGLPGVAAGHPGGLVELEGALRSPTTFAADWDPATRAAFETALRRRIEPPSGAEDDLIPPVYGLSYTGRRHFTGDAEQVAWLRELNLDPRYRAIAALGTRAVQDHQEDLVAAAWEQVAALADVNRALRQGQLGRTVAKALYDRRLDRTRPGSVLADDRLLQVSQPVQGDLGTSAALAAAAGLEATTTPGFRKVTRRGGTLAKLGGSQVAAPMARLAAKTLAVNPALPVPPGMAAVERFSSSETMKTLTGNRVKLPPWALPLTGPTGTPVPADPQAMLTGAAMPGRTFVTSTDGRLLSYVTSLTTAVSGWQDHGRPPGTTVVSQPTAIRDLRCYVGCADGHIRALEWNGDYWAWSTKALPGGVTVPAGRAPYGQWADSWPIGGGLARSGTYDMVWVVGGNGVLYENRNDHWISHGTPPGVTLTGEVGSLSPTSILVIGSDGWLWNYALDDNAKWQWTVRKHPTLPTGPLGGSARPAKHAGFWWAAGQTTTDLYLGVPWFSYALWTARHDLGAVLGVTSQGFFFSTTAGTVVRCDASGTFSTYLPAPPGWTTGAVLRGSMRDEGTVVVGVGGHYLEGDSGGWHDRGVPTMGGVGSPTAAPPAHRRWRPFVGIMSDIVVSHVDAAAGGDRVHVRAGANVGYDAEVRDGWALRTPMPETIGAGTMGMGVALADVKQRGGDAPRRDLVALWVADYHGGNFITYNVGWDVDATGNAASWSGIKRCPTPIATSITSGGALTERVSIVDCDIDVVDLDDDQHPELVLAYVTGHNPPRAYYRVGWRLDASGDVTQGWTESQPLPAPPAGQVVGVGACVADTTAGLTPDLVVLYIVRPTPGAALQARYHIGRGFNARGLVTGGWTGPIPVGGDPLPTDLQGTALTAADFSGSEAADLLLTLVENTPTENHGRYRIGWDLSARTGAARTWSSDRPIPGWFGWENRGAGVAVGDLDPGGIADKKDFANHFLTAAQTHQAAIVAVQQPAAGGDAAVPLATVAAAARAGLEPSARVEARVAARIDGVDLRQVPATDRLANVLAAPSFGVPAYELVRDIARDYLLPGVDAVPPDTVSLLRATPDFIEAFMVGLNHEMGREFLWRELPADRTATFFRAFWDRGDGAPDLPPISTWNPAARLGQSATGMGGPDMAVLVVRGELLRRFPNTAVYAIRAAFAANGSRVLTATTRQPDFRGTMAPDLTFFGFSFTVAEARGMVGGPAPDPGWFFAFAEHPTEPRFGLDEPPDSPVYGDAPGAWSDLDWARVVTGAAALDALAHVPAGLPFPRETALPLRLDHGPGADTFRWAENAAHTAHITLQRPVLMAIHATDLLASTSGDWHVTHVVRSPRAISAVAGQHPDGSWWRLELAAAIAAIGKHERLYVQPAGGTAADIVVAHKHDGTPYLRTRAGGGEGNNLSKLPNLPAGAMTELRADS